MVSSATTARRYDLDPENRNLRSVALDRPDIVSRSTVRPSTRQVSSSNSEPLASTVVSYGARSPV
ncbi:hypothetical protein BRD02_03360 [Halobacteriales archaeon QS_8_69_73]|nr:MAG: hypothetical protein BRD02_03360 [Halobacteriales archaeon QS_8_69_73]